MGPFFANGFLSTISEDGNMDNQWVPNYLITMNEAGKCTGCSQLSSLYFLCQYHSSGLELGGWHDSTPIGDFSNCQKRGLMAYPRGISLRSQNCNFVLIDTCNILDLPVYINIGGFY